MGGSENFKIYKNDIFCVRLIALNGWKEKQVKEIETILLKIMEKSDNIDNDKNGQ